MSALLKKTRYSQIQSFLLLGLVFFFIAHFLLLSPSTLEDDFNGMRVIEPKELLNFLKNEPTSLSPEVPLNAPPSYSLRDDVIYSSDGTKPQFKIISRKANLYQTEQIAHSRDVLVEFPDRTQISATESVFYIKENRVRFYGKVHTQFPNGAELLSEYAEAIIKPTLKIMIPTSKLAHGKRRDAKTLVEFTSQGLEYLDAPPKDFHLLTDVHVQISGNKKTHVESDQAIYNHDEGKLHFFMNESRPLSEQFVKARQADLDLKSRTLDVETSSNQKLETITAVGDVYIRDSHDPEKLTTGTSGLATYDDVKNEIRLTEFPQVYQDNDTITGDIIVFHRNTDLIEVRQSNAIYNNRNEPAPKPNTGN